MRFLEILTDWLRLKLGRVTPMASFMVITFNLVTSEKDFRLIKFQIIEIIFDLVT